MSGTSVVVSPDSQQVQSALNNIDDKRLAFFDLTHQLNNYNEIYNINKHLENSGAVELSRLSRTNDSLKSKNMEIKQRYILYDRTKSVLILKNNLLYFSIVVICLVLIIVGLSIKQKLSMKTTVILVSIILLLFVIISIIVVRVNSRRRNIYWNQYYFNKTG